MYASFQLCLKDESFFRQFAWHTLVVDEAHRLKNRDSLLHQALLDVRIISVFQTLSQYHTDKPLYRQGLSEEWGALWYRLHSKKVLFTQISYLYLSTAKQGR